MVSLVNKCMPRNCHDRGATIPDQITEGVFTILEDQVSFRNDITILSCL